LHFDETLVVARKLSLGQVEHLVVLETEDGNLEVWDTTDEDQVFGAARESHS
jgi:hypothetical protein